MRAARSTRKHAAFDPTLVLTVGQWIATIRSTRLIDKGGDQSVEIKCQSIGRTLVSTGDVAIQPEVMARE